jgi:DNA-binding LacI/PurR family transcriptional regulator
MPDESVPNIYAVAKRAGVSTATVSRVLSRPEVVAPSMRRKVMRAVELLGCVPNSGGQESAHLEIRQTLGGRSGQLKQRGFN